MLAIVQMQQWNFYGFQECTTWFAYEREKIAAEVNYNNNF